jgi:hypothetical protein
MTEERLGRCLRLLLRQVYFQSSVKQKNNQKFGRRRSRRAARRIFELWIRRLSRPCSVLFSISLKGNNRTRRFSIE